jgi:hypothetical protein
MNIFLVFPFTRLLRALQGQGAVARIACVPAMAPQPVLEQSRSAT